MTKVWIAATYNPVNRAREYFTFSTAKGACDYARACVGYEVSVIETTVDAYKVEG